MGSEKAAREIEEQKESVGMELMKMATNRYSSDISGDEIPEKTRERVVSQRPRKTTRTSNDFLAV